MKNTEFNLANSPVPDPEPSDKYYTALTAYLAKYNANGQRPMLPLRASSYVGTKFVYLRKWNYLIAIYSIESRDFVKLTEELIRKYSANAPPS